MSLPSSNMIRSYVEFPPKSDNKEVGEISKESRQGKKALFFFKTNNK